MFEFLGLTAIVLQEANDGFVIHGDVKVLLLAATVKAHAKIGDVVELGLSLLFALPSEREERSWFTHFKINKITKTIIVPVYDRDGSAAFLHGSGAIENEHPKQEVVCVRGVAQAGG